MRTGLEWSNAERKDAQSVGEDVVRLLCGAVRATSASELRRRRRHHSVAIANNTHHPDNSRNPQNDRLQRIQDAQHPLFVLAPGVVFAPVPVRIQVVVDRVLHGLT